jgi:hypothetical protein
MTSNLLELAGSRTSGCAARWEGPCVSEKGSFITHLVDSDTDVCRDCGYAPSPSVQWNHCDGPLMHLAGGRLHWLTLRERFMHWIGRWSLEDIAAALRARSEPPQATEGEGR